MKKKGTVLIVSIVSAFLCLPFLLLANGNKLFSSFFAFPFEQIAFIIKHFEQSGALLKGLALMLFALCSALPVLFAFRSKARTAERVTLVLLGCTVAFALYAMINPTLFERLGSRAHSEYRAVYNGCLGLSVWSMLILYAVIALIGKLHTADKNALSRSLRLMLTLLAAVLSAQLVLELGGDLVTALNKANCAFYKVFGVLEFISRTLPVLAIIAIILALDALLYCALSKDQSELSDTARRLERVCAAALIVIAAAPAVFNILQVAFMKKLSNVSISVQVPVIHLVLAVGVLLLTKLFIENKHLRDDNDLFI